MSESVIAFQEVEYISKKMISIASDKFFERGVCQFQREWKRADEGIRHRRQNI